MAQRVHPQASRLLVAVLCLGTGLHCGGNDRARAPTGDHVDEQLGQPRFVDPITEESVAAEEFTLVFGRVAVRTSARRELLLRNNGRGVLTVVGFQFSDAGLGDAFDYPAPPLTVGPGSQASLTITFRPPSAGVFNGSLQLTIAGGDRAALTVLLTGTGYHGDSPALELAPSQLDFGEVPLSASAARRMTLANVGVDVPGTTADNLRFAVVGDDGALVDIPPQITGPDASEFSVDWPPARYGAAGLAEGETAELRVRFAPLSEGMKAATLLVDSNDPKQPHLEVPLSGIAVRFVQCVLDVVPAALNFGTVDTSKYLTLSVSLANRDPDPSSECRILSLDLTRDTRERGAFALAYGPVEDLPVFGGHSVLVPVRFAPKQGGHYSGEIAFSTSTSRLATPQTVPLLGIAQSDCLMIAPRELDFGTIGVPCTSRQRLFTMYNTCASNLVVTAIDMQQGPSTEFSITKMPVLPVTITGGAQSDFGVTYRPVDIGDDTASVAVTLQSDPNSWLVPLQARGAMSPPQRDVFSVNPLALVDVLFVIDDSSTMADKQAALSTNLSTFITYALRQFVDLHVAVTTTDLSSTGAAGRLLPLAATNSLIVTTTTPNAAQVFSQLAAVGTSGSDTESLLRPAYLALSNPLITGHNAGFYRDEAELAVIIVSDAADQDPLSTSVADYKSFFDNLKRYVGQVSVSAIVPTLSQAPPGCSYDTATAGLDTRVRQVVQHTGGVEGDICDSNWVTTLAPLVTPLYGPTTKFWLSNTPDLSITPDPIVVTVDGHRFDQYAPSGLLRWDYNSYENAVEFDALVVRDIAGTRIEISYRVPCL